jgi:uncharacterized UPF0160 family protein
MNWLKNKKVIAVHNRRFHSDDIFSVAVLSILHNGAIKVIRTRDEKEYAKADYIIDVGLEYNPVKNKFDHHQEGGAAKRPDGSDYAAFGLLWLQFGEKICGSKEVADRIEKRLVKANDLIDNSVDIFSKTIKDVTPYLIEDGLEIFNLTWLEAESLRDEHFDLAVKMAKEILLREIKVWTDRVQGEKEVERFYRESVDKRIIILNGRYPWEEVVNKYPEPLFVVSFREDSGQWGVTTVRDDLASFKSRLFFPKNWGGKRDAELALITGVKDALYCHHNLWLAIAGSKEGAIKLAKLAIESVNL